MTHFRSLGQKSKNNFVRFLVQMRTRQFAFGIYWPLDTIMFVSQATKRCPEREWKKKEKGGTNRKKRMFSLVTAPVTLKDPQTKANDVFWWITYFLWFAQITNFSSLRQRSNTQKEEDCYESWELIWGIFPAVLAPVLRF